MTDRGAKIAKILTSDKNIDYTPSVSNEQSKLEAPATQIIPCEQSSAQGILPAEKQCNLPSSNMLKQASQSQSFAASLVSLFGSTTVVLM